jgi:hypothetical protein
MQDIVTTDLSEYGYKELAEAGELLKAYGDDGAEFLNDGITLNFNTYSGIVFLSDSDYNVGVLEDGHLVQFYNCPYCGNEGTQNDGLENGWDFEKHEGYCSAKCQKA